MLLEDDDLGTLISLVLALLVGLLTYVYVYIYQSKTNDDAVDNGNVIPGVELPPLPPIKLTREQLKSFDGTRPDGRILIAFKGKIYDVSNNVDDFGLRGTLNRVAGRDFTKYLKIIMSLSESEVNIMDSWEHDLEMNYKRVGVLINEQGEILQGDEDDEDLYPITIGADQNDHEELVINVRPQVTNYNCCF